MLFCRVGGLEQMPSIRGFIMNLTKHGREAYNLTDKSPIARDKAELKTACFEKLAAGTSIYYQGLKKEKHAAQPQRGDS